MINIPDTGEAERVFRALSERGRVNMPMEETFWAHRFGMTAWPLWRAVDDQLWQGGLAIARPAAGLVPPVPGKAV